MTVEEEIAKVQKEVIENRKRRRWPSATDLLKTTLGLKEEVAEFETARCCGDEDEMVDALADIAVFCLGGFEILGKNALVEIVKVVSANRTRVSQVPH